MFAVSRVTFSRHFAMLGCKCSWIRKTGLYVRRVINMYDPTCLIYFLDRYSEYGAAVLLLLMATFALIAHWLAW